jgi:glycerophosphoryl diester phosphodiesterase
VREVHDAGLRVATWTANDPARIAALLEWGVDTIITDEVERVDPSLARQRAA